MDSRDPEPPGSASSSSRAPDQLSYRDATYLYGSSIPRDEAIMTTLSGALSGAPDQTGSALANFRATSEAALIALAGSALGLGLSWLELHAIHDLYAGSGDAYGRLAHFDPLGVLWALGLAALATIAAGLYPAWRIGRVPPALYLKSQ